MGGAFLTSREIFENPIWQDVQKFRIFFFIYGNAVFAEEGVRIGGIKIQRGQFLRSYRNLSKDLEYVENKSVKTYSVSVIKRKVDSLVKENRLKIEETELGTLFTVVNYEEYQGFQRYSRKNVEQCWNSDGTVLEQQRNNNNKDIKDIKDNDIYIPVFEHWNSKEIIVHRKANAKMISHINARLEDYDLESVLEAIDNYKTIVDSDEYYFNYRWTLQDFMTPNRFAKFLTASKPFDNYRNKYPQNKRTGVGTKRDIESELNFDE